MRCGGKDYSSFSEDEQAVMELADELALNNPHGKLTPELHAKLKRHFSDEEILELGLCLSIIVGLVKLSFAFGLVEKEELLRVWHAIVGNIAEETPREMQFVMSTNVVESWQINPDAEADDLEAKQPFIDNGLDVLDPFPLLQPGIHGTGMGENVDPDLADCRH